MTTGKKVLIGCAIAFGVFLLGVGAIIGLALFATSGITDVAKDQLSALRAGDMEKAYSYTSKDFQAKTSLDDFKKTLDEYPELKLNETSSFTSREVENDQGTIKGTIKSKDGGSTPVTFRLVKENDEWKITGINLQLPGITEDNTSGGTNPFQQARRSNPSDLSNSTSTIVNIMLNDKVNKDGFVEEHMSVFATSTPEIQVSAFVQNATKGMTIDSLLLFTATGDQVGPATNTVEEEGNIISNFAFSKPTNGWPVGDYKIAVRISTGEVKDVDFQVK